MKKIFIGFLTVILLAGCSPAIEKNKIESQETTIEENKVAYSKISAEQAKEIIKREEVIILDVRTPEEYKEEHIEDALLIPDYDLKDLVEGEIPNKDEKILLYCRSGNRSKAAAKILVDMGYTNVYDFGGIIDWPYETVK